MPRYTNKNLLDKARDFYKKHGHVPKMRDFPRGLQQTPVSRFGSWEAYIKLSLGKETERHIWTDDELLKAAKEFWQKNNRFPVNEDLMALNHKLRSRMQARFGTINAWLEKAIGASPRIEILRTIHQLTPPGCEQATTQEILAVIRKRMNFPSNLFGSTASSLQTEGFILGGQYDKTRWWKLTSKGRELLKQFRNSQSPPERPSPSIISFGRAGAIRN